MHAFTDGKKRVWELEINVEQIRRVKDRCKVNLVALVADGLQPLAELVADPVALVDVLHALVADECEARSVTPADFGRAMFGDAINFAADAFVDELMDFFPDARARMALGKVVRKSRTIHNKAMDRVNEAIDKIDPENEQTIEQVLAQMSNISNRSSGGSPVSSA